MAEGRYSFGVKDFRMVKTASLKPEGVTLVYGKNGNGKSTVLRALKAVLDNDGSDSHCRHGTDGYAVGIKIADRKLIYTRKGGASTVKLDDGETISKLGKGPMSGVVPTFPFKRVDFSEDHFYPNFVMQNGVPLFGDISVTDLFASMFADMGRVSGRVDELNKSRLALGKLTSSSEVKYQTFKKLSVDADDALRSFEEKHPDLEAIYNTSLEVVKHKEEVDKFFLEYGKLSAECADESKRKMALVARSEGEALYEMFKVLEEQDDLQRLIDHRDDILVPYKLARNQLDRLVLEFPEEVRPLITEVVGFLQIKDFLAKGEVVLARYDVDTDYVVQVSVFKDLFDKFDASRQLVASFEGVDSELLEAVIFRAKLQDSLATRKMSLQLLVKEYEGLQEELKAIPCTRYVDGTCPFQSKIAGE